MKNKQEAYDKIEKIKDLLIDLKTLGVDHKLTNEMYSKASELIEDVRCKIEEDE